MPERKVTENMDNAQAEAMCDQVASSIVQMLEWNAKLSNQFEALELSFESLYKMVFQLCVERHSRTLCTRLEQLIGQHVLNRWLINLIDSANISTVILLQTVVDAWQQHQLTMNMLHTVLKHMNKAVLYPNGFGSVTNLGLQSFYTHLLSDPRVMTPFREALLSTLAIDRDRKLDVNMKMTLKSTCQMLMMLGAGKRTIYETVLERPYLLQTAQFYRAASERYLASEHVPAYLEQTEEAIKAELDRVMDYLDPSTVPRVAKVLDMEFIGRHMTTLIQMESSGVLNMLQTNNTQDLGAMYKMFRRVNTVPLRKTISAYILSQGELFTQSTESNSQPSREEIVNSMGSIVILKERLDAFLRDSFDNDTGMRHQILADFTHILEMRKKAAEELTAFIDETLKKTTLTSTEQEIENIFERTMDIFRLIRDKDAFERYYRQKLAIRLLRSIRNTDYDYNYERSMLSKIKAECGYMFTCKLEGMIKDVQLSDSLMPLFNSTVRTVGRVAGKLQKQTIEISVKVLTTGFWPFQVAAMCNIPPEIQASFDDFKTFFATCAKGRMLRLQLQHGSADMMFYLYGRSNSSDVSVKQESDTGTKSGLIFSSVSKPADYAQPLPSEGFTRHIVQVTTYQMILLLLFNKHCQWTYDELLQETEIPCRDLIQSLRLLSMCKRGRILNKEPKTQDVDPTDVFSINETFSSKLVRVKVQEASVSAEEKEENEEALESSLKVQRAHEIDAALIRVMKTRRSVSHIDLVAEVVTQLSNRFLPTTAMIKMRIEMLITREYIARNETDRDLYNYVA